MVYKLAGESRARSWDKQNFLHNNADKTLQFLGFLGEGRVHDHIFLLIVGNGLPLTGVDILSSGLLRGQLCGEGTS